MCLRAGMLEWESRNFYSNKWGKPYLEMGADGPVLHATLEDENEIPVESTMALGRRIGDDDKGNLVFLESAIQWDLDEGDDYY